MEEWRFIDFGLVDIRDMMAMDEAILKGDEGNTFFFWTPKKSIILGFFQKAEVELDLSNAKTIPSAAYKRRWDSVLR